LELNMLLKNPYDFTIGTDSEFIITNDTGRLIRADNYVDEDNDLGCDGNGAIWEVRSNPSKNPVEVVAGIREIMRKAIKNTPNIYNWKWLGGSFVKRSPLGTHVHFNIPKNIISAKDACSQFLDHYVGSISLLLENRKQGLARRAYNKSPGGHNVSYGKASDFRDGKSHGGYEYRTPSSAIHSPSSMHIILCLSKAVMYSAINQKSFRPKTYVKPDDFVTMNTEKIRAIFPEIWEDIQSLQLYKEYQSYLDIIPYLVKNNLTWHYKRTSMKESWDIIPLTPKNNTHNIPIEKI